MDTQTAEFLSRLEDKVDRLQESSNQVKLEQVAMRHILAENTKDVAEHIRRTNILEKEVLFPVRAAKWLVAGVVGGAGVITAVYGVVKLFAV